MRRMVAAFLGLLGLAACGEDHVEPSEPARRALADPSGWPNAAGWAARADGRVIETEDGTPYHLHVVSAGTLHLPSGRLVIVDPFTMLRRTGNPYVDVPPGSYPVEVTIADVSGKDDGSHLREAYVSLLLADGPEVVRRPLTPSPEGTIQPDLGPEEFVGFGVDAGSGCLVDAAALEAGMPPEAEWYERVFDDGTASSWFAQMDAASNVREGLANIVLPRAESGENIVIFHTGWGDGRYPIVGGFDAEGRLVAVHVDLFVL